jgi:hypothetical protein
MNKILYHWELEPQPKNAHLKTRVRFQFYLKDIETRESLDLPDGRAVVSAGPRRLAGQAELLPGWIGCFRIVRSWFQTSLFLRLGPDPLNF